MRVIGETVSDLLGVLEKITGYQFKPVITCRPKRKPNSRSAYCSECGKTLSPKYRFCPRCGAQIIRHKGIERDTVVYDESEDVRRAVHK